MIVKMKKTTLFVRECEKEEALKQLRKLGVMHIKNVKPPISDDISTIEGQLNKITGSIKILSHYNETNQKVEKTEETVPENEKLVNEILTLKENQNRLSEQLETEKKKSGWYQIWGDIHKSDVSLFREKGLFLRLYACNEKLLETIPAENLVYIINKEKDKVNIALISENEDDGFDHKEVLIPQESLETVNAKISETGGELQRIEERLVLLSDYLDKLECFKQEVQKELEFAEAKYGMGNAEEIAYLEGFCPEDSVSQIKKTADKEYWGYIFKDPDITDNPPTLLKNKKWVNIIQPVFDFLGTVPGYREFDISNYFLIFFSIYFAMIIGDAGYGMIFMLISLFAHRKISKAGKPLPLAIKLLYVLSTTTMIWGAITGNWFGAKEIGALGFFKAITIPQLAAFPEIFPDLKVNPQDKVMFICFVLALIQLGLANIMNFLRDFPNLKCFGSLGWFSLTAALFFLVLNLVLGISMPGFVPILIGISLGLIIIFSNQEKDVSFMSGLSKGLGGAFTTFLDSISSFSNIISYIRLFAVGMATVAIASSFNNIAAPMLKGFALPAGILVLVIGHSLNLVMGMLSVVVHGIRLNVLEFSGQLGVEWSGYKYKPFSNNKNQESN